MLKKGSSNAYILFYSSLYSWMIFLLLWSWWLRIQWMLMLTVLFPMFLKSSIIILPSFLIGHLDWLQSVKSVICFWPFSHNDYFLIFFKISNRNFSMIDLNISKIPMIFYWIIFIKTYQIHIIVWSFEENRSVIVEIQIK